jgi:hypothetical protein
VPDEDVATRGLGPAIAEVRDEGVGHLRQEGQDQQPSGLGLGEGDLLVAPVDVIETELANVTGSHAEPRRQQQDRVVPLAQRRAPIDRLEQCGDLGVGQEVRDACEAVLPHRGGGRREVELQETLEEGPAKKTAQGTGIRPPGLGSLLGQLRHQERPEGGRLHLLPGRDAASLEVDGKPGELERPFADRLGRDTLMLLEEVQIGGDGLLEQGIGHPSWGEDTAGESAFGVHLEEDPDRRPDPAPSAGTPAGEAHREVSWDFRVVNGAR